MPALAPLPYVLAFAPACALLIAFIWRDALKAGFPKDRVAAAIAACATGAVIGSKVLMFDFHAAQYGEKTFLGAVAGGMLTVFVVSRVFAFGARAFDVPVIPVLWGAALGRVGCLLSGCCHGVATTVPWGVRYTSEASAFKEQVALGLIDANATASLPVHPTQLYEAVLDVALAVLLMRRRGAFRRQGSVALAGAVGICFIRFVVDPFRAEAVWVGGVTVVQLTTLALMAIAGVALWARESGASIPKVADAAPVPAVRPMQVLVAVAAVTALANQWLTPLEIALIVGVVAVTAFAVARHIVPRVIFVSPAIGLAVFLPQDLAVRPDTVMRPDTMDARSWYVLGGGIMRGGYEVTTENCEGKTLTSQQHSYWTLGGMYERHDETKPGIGHGWVASAFFGNETAPEATSYDTNATVAGPIDRAMGGASVAYLKDWKYFGIGGGAAFGRWAYGAPTGTLSKAQLLPIVRLRVGPAALAYFEAESGLSQPSPAPLPAIRVGLAYAKGDNLVRGGVSDAGGYLGVRFVNGRNEIEPMVSFESTKRYQLSIMFRSRTYQRGGPRKASTP